MSANKVVTGKVRFSYLTVFEAKAIGNGEPKYSVSLIIDKDDKKTLSRIKKAIEAAKQEGKTSKWGGKIPPNLKTPLRDGSTDRPEDEAYHGKMFVNANSKIRPQVIDADFQEIIDPEEVVSGDYGRADLSFYPYKVEGSQGVACGLNNLQFLEKGDPLSSRTDAVTAFSEADDLEDDEDWDDDDMM